MKDARIVIIGGGAAAEAKLRTLVKTEANLVLIAPQISDEIQRWAQNGHLEWQAKDWTKSDFANARLIYAASEQADENSKIASIARELGILCNAADQKQDCDFITPALVDRSPVVVSIGTEGTSPSLARALKSDLEARLPSTLGVLANTLKSARAKLATKIPDLAARQRFWADIFQGPDLAKQLRTPANVLESQIADRLARGAQNENAGMVSLVGAGPGDADLLTHQARQKLHGADVIVYDRLVSQDVLDFGRREAEYIYVGKEPGGKSTPQDEINAIIVQQAKRGLHVVRLKGGDPLIFGRADEEIEALQAAGIAFEICPGITSAAAAAAAIGVSLTSRGTNKAISFVTGHDAKGFAEQDWTALAANGARSAIYMGVGAARFIQGRLMLHGASGALPVTIVENASRPNQIIVQSTLAALPDDILAGGIKGPAILLIGYSPAVAITAPNQIDTKRVNGL